jgi:hypothetical protein
VTARCGHDSEPMIEMSRKRVIRRALHAGGLLLTGAGAVTAVVITASLLSAGLIWLVVIALTFRELLGLLVR